MNTVRIIDTETTGLDPEVDRVVEIAKIDWIDGDIMYPLAQLVDPGIKVDSSYLTWIVDKSDMGEAEKFTAKYWLESRS